MFDSVAGTSSLQAIDSAAAAKANWAAVAVSGGKHMSEVQIDKASKDFESVFLSQMLENMFGDSIGDEQFGDAETQDIYKGLMMEQYGKQITNSGGIGIAGFVKQELLKLQEVRV